MKQVYLIHEYHPCLLLFFAGWGADETPFKAYRPAGRDFMLCYDYRTLSFDASPLTAYRRIDLVGWSMGVWAATQVIPHLSLPVGDSIAINGTPFPIDETRGIPPAIFQGTLDGLTGASLHKFLRRMCVNSNAFRAFLQVTPRRPLEELREELACIRETVLSAGKQPVFHWQQAVVGASDRIIPPGNQQHAWTEQNTPVIITPDAHYQESLFRHYLQDLWTND